MFLLGVFTSLALVVCASASCCMPEKFTAGIRIITSGNGTFYESMGVHYANTVKGVYVSYVNSTDTEGVSSLTKYHYNILTGDTYGVIGGRCTKDNLKMQGINKAKPNCIPDNAMGPSFTVGGPHEDLEVFNMNNPLKNGMIQNTLTKHHCIPVHQMIYFAVTTHNNSKVSAVQMIEFFNLKTSVNDLSVFVIPDICKNVTS